MDKKRINLFSIILTIFGLVFSGVVTYNLFVNKENNPYYGGNIDENGVGNEELRDYIENTITYTFGSDKKSILFYDQKNLVGTYTCQTETCNIPGIYSGEALYNLSLMKRVFIEDGNTYLYDIEKGEVIGDYQQAYRLGYRYYNGKKDDQNTLFIVRNHESKYGMLDLYGEVKEIIPFRYEELGTEQYLEWETIADSKSDRYRYIKAKKDGLYGAVSTKNGKVIVPFKYDNIYIYENKNIVVEKNNTQYVVSSDNKILFDKKSDKIFLYDKFVVLIKDKQLYIADYEGNTLIKDYFNIYLKDEPDCGVSITEDNNKFLMIIKLSKYEKDYITYEFDYNFNMLYIENSQAR